MEYYLYPILDQDYINHHSIKKERLNMMLKKTQFYQFRAKNQKKENIQSHIYQLYQSFPKIKMILNDYIDFLEICDGIHLGIEDLNTIPDLKNIIQKHQNLHFAKNIEEWLYSDRSCKIIGISTHNLQQFQDIYFQYHKWIGYIAIGPCFPTTTKNSAYPVLSPEEKNSILQFISKQKIPQSIVCIGGIQKNNLYHLHQLFSQFPFFLEKKIYYASISTFLRGELPEKFNFTKSYHEKKSFRRG